MKIFLPRLDRSYDVPKKTLHPYTQAEMAKALPMLRGRSLFIDFQKDIDGPQTATRLIRETLEFFGSRERIRRKPLSGYKVDLQK